MGKWVETELGKIPKDWEYLTVSDLIQNDIIFKPLDGNHGNIHPKGTDYTETGIPFVMASDINNSKIDLKYCKFIAVEQANQLQKGFAETGDVLLTHKATIGRTAIVEEIETPYIMLTPQVTYYRVKDPEKLNNRFLKYFFDYKKFQDLLALHAGAGSTRAYIGITAQHNLPIILPNIEEQKVIAGVLSSLDDKINLLNSQNKTLEQMAETLFDHHFTNNPDKQNWEEKALDKVANYLNGVACQKYPVIDDSKKLPVLKIKELKSGISDISDWANTDISSDYIIENGDIIFSWSGSLLVKIWDGEKCILNQHLFKVTSDVYPKWFIYYWTKYHLNKFIAIAEDKATTMGHIKRSDLATSMVWVPDNDYLENINKEFTPLFDKIVLNQKQIQTLESLRDTLLPKLMSGEVRVDY